VVLDSFLGRHLEDGLGLAECVGPIAPSSGVGDAGCWMGRISLVSISCLGQPLRSSSGAASSCTA
jgi:hypothetical protein